MTKGSNEKLVNAFDKSTWDDAEEAYFEYVDSTIAESNDEIFSNGKAWHAAYLIFKFLELATKHIRIFSGTLVQTTPQGVAIYCEPKIVEAACAFLKKEHSKLQIVLEREMDAPNNDPNEHPLIQGIRRLKDEGSLRGTLEIRRLSPQTVVSLRERKALHHMMLVDERGWRIEVESNPNDVKAVVNAGNARETSVLCQAFDTGVWEAGENLISITN